MKTSFLALSALAGAALGHTGKHLDDDKPMFFNTEWKVVARQDFALSFGGCHSGCTISLQNGATENSMKDVKVLTEQTSGSTFNVNLESVPAGVCAFKIINNSSRKENYGQKIDFDGPIAPADAPPSPTGIAPEGSLPTRIGNLPIGSLPTGIGKLPIGSLPVGGLPSGLSTVLRPIHHQSTASGIVPAITIPPVTDGKTDPVSHMPGPIFNTTTPSLPANTSEVNVPAVATTSPSDVGEPVPTTGVVPPNTTAVGGTGDLGNATSSVDPSSRLPTTVISSVAGRAASPMALLAGVVVAAVYFL